MKVPSFESSILMFTALFSLYSPLATISSYFPIVGGLNARQHGRLALGLFFNVSVFALVALWVGEPLLELLGITTDALVVTGGIALMYAGVAQMRGIDGYASEQPSHREGAREGAQAAADGGAWKSVLFMPTTFPLTVGGATFAILVSFRARSESVLEVALLSVVAVAYAGVTALTLYLSGQIERRVSERTRAFLEKIAGILLTAIAVSLLAKGAPTMVMQTLDALHAGTAEPH